MPGKPAVAASGAAGWGACERLELKRPATLRLVREERAKSSDDGVLLVRMNYIFPMVAVAIDGNLVQEADFASTGFAGGAEIEVIHLTSGGYGSSAGVIPSQH